MATTAKKADAERRASAAEAKRKEEAAARAEAAKIAEAEARAAEEAAAAAQKAADEAEAFQAQLLAIEQHEQEQATKHRNDSNSATQQNCSGSSSSEVHSNSTGNAVAQQDSSSGSTAVIEGDFNIEMALGRDLLGDLGIDDDDGGMLAMPDLLSPKAHTAAVSQSPFMDEQQRRDNRLNDCLCPITHEIMRDPVIDALGHSYERKAIETWLSKNNTSPITNAALPHRSLVTNHALRKLIASLSTEERASIKRRASKSNSPAQSGSTSPSGRKDGDRDSAQMRGRVEQIVQAV